MAVTFREDVAVEQQVTVELWVALGILAIVVAGLVGFWIGRATSNERKLIRELEAELDRRMQELTRYRSQVNEHFERTATLFASMAGTYRDLYHHLAQGAEDLADKPVRERLEDRAGLLLSNMTHRDDGSAPREAAGGANETDTEDEADSAKGQRKSVAAEPAADRPRPD